MKRELVKEGGLYVLNQHPYRGKRNQNLSLGSLVQVLDAPHKGGSDLNWELRFESVVNVVRMKGGKADGEPFPVRTRWLIGTHAEQLAAQAEQAGILSARENLKAARAVRAQELYSLDPEVVRYVVGEAEAYLKGYLGGGTGAEGDGVWLKRTREIEWGINLRAAGYRQGYADGRAHELDE
jgi:hypothetical protein